MIKCFGYLRYTCPNTEFFLVRIFLYSVRIQEITDQKKFRIWTFHAVFIYLYCDQRSTIDQISADLFSTQRAFTCSKSKIETAANNSRFSPLKAKTWSHITLAASRKVNCSSDFVLGFVRPIFGSLGKLSMVTELILEINPYGNNMVECFIFNTNGDFLLNLASNSHCIFQMW